MEPDSITNNNHVQPDIADSNQQVTDDVLKNQLIDRFVASGLTQQEAQMRVEEVLRAVDKKPTEGDQKPKHIPVQETKENESIANQIIQKALERNMFLPDVELTAREVLAHAFDESRGSDIRTRTQAALAALNRYVDLNRRTSLKKANHDAAVKQSSTNPFASLQKPAPPRTEDTGVNKEHNNSDVQHGNTELPETQTKEIEKQVDDAVGRDVAEKEIVTQEETEMTDESKETQAASLAVDMPRPLETPSVAAIEPVITKPASPVGGLAKQALEPTEKQETAPPVIENVAPAPDGPALGQQQTVPAQQIPEPTAMVPDKIEKPQPTVVNVSSKDVEFFSKYVSEQIETVTAVISHNEQLPPDMVAGIRETLTNAANTIAKEVGTSVSDRIQRLDALFTEYKTEYATGSVADHIPTEDTINRLLSLADSEVSTGNKTNDMRFRETLNNALHNKVRQMKDADVTVSEIHIALKEEYEMIKKFYLMSNA